MAARAIAQVHLHFFSFSLRGTGAASDDAAAPPAPPRDCPRGALRGPRATRPPRACDAREQSAVEAAANNSSMLQPQHCHSQQSFRIRQGREQRRRRRQAQRQRQRLQWGEGAIWTCCFCGRGCGGDGSSSSWQRRHQQQRQERRQQQERQQREEQGGRQSSDGGPRGHGDLRGLNSREQTQIKWREIARGRVTAACKGLFAVSGVIGLNSEGKRGERRKERKLMNELTGRKAKAPTNILSLAGGAGGTLFEGKRLGYLHGVRGEEVHDKT